MHGPGSSGADGPAALPVAPARALGNGLVGTRSSSRWSGRSVGAGADSAGPLAELLMAALASGERAGGDIRGQQSAASLVLERNGGCGALGDRHVVISVQDHARPIDELMRFYDNRIDNEGLFDFEVPADLHLSYDSELDSAVPARRPQPGASGP